MKRLVSTPPPNCFPFHKVENRSSFPKLRFVQKTLQGGEGTILCVRMPKENGCVLLFFD